MSFSLATPNQPLTPSATDTTPTAKVPVSKPRRLTQAITREYVRRLGGFLAKTPAGDYRLRFHFAGSSDYFTSDLLDVVETARAYCGSHPAIDSAEEYLRSQGVNS